MSLEITFDCNSVNQDLTINIENSQGKYKLIGSGSLGVIDPNSEGGTDYNFTILVQEIGSNNPPISFDSNEILENKIVQCAMKSTDYLDVIVIENRDSSNLKKRRKNVKLKVS